MLPPDGEATSPDEDGVGGDGSGLQRTSGDEAASDDDDPVGEAANHGGKRKRPISVSCELCKQRKVKCDRGQPSCGWCSRNGQLCEYKERKKPGLRAGYGRELEQRLDKLEEILRAHSEIIHATFTAAQTVTTGLITHQQPPSSLRGSNASLPSDHGTPREASSSIFTRAESMRANQSQAETALFLQKPSTYPPVSQTLDFGIPPPTPTLHDGMTPAVPLPGLSPTNHNHMAAMSGVSTAPGIASIAAQEYYGSSSAVPLPSPTTNLVHSQGQGLSSDQDLPPYDLLYALVDLYFKHINTWCPILHRKTTLDSLFGPTMIEETDQILLHGIVATTLRYSTDARLTEERRRHYHLISKQRVLLYGMENSSVKSLQALVILSLDLCGDGNGPPGWNIMALITRSVVQLGLAVETSSFSVRPDFTSIYTLRAMILPEPKDFIEEESRRRLFWMIYLLDRYATIATAFEFALDDREIDRTLPCRDDLWVKNQKVETRWFSDHENQIQHEPHNPDSPDFKMNKPQNLGAFSYYIEILGILTKIHNFLKQPVDISALSDVEQWQMRYKELDNTLTSWKFGLPGEFGNMAKLFQPGSAKQLNCAWVMLHATYHTAVIRLHSSAAYPTTRSPIFHPSYSASQRCHGAVENIQALGEFVANSGLLSKLGPPFAFTLWVAARLLLVHGSTVEHKLSPQLPFFVDCLREMGRYWPVAARYCNLLERVLDEYREAERQGQAQQQAQPTSVKILADMRRTAFDLDFLISRQPRHIPGVTPVRTPQANDLEYVDIFDFFNVPRLPLGAPTDLMGGMGSESHSHGGGGSSNNGTNRDGGGGGGGGAGGAGSVGAEHGNSNEYNITDFMVDANRDWFKQDGAKFLA
ncbi:fungal-specific transcription factor domain-domain-containing protein [Coniella lustricola]|uniref:Fungal-specific transcription factor domain-domain-containing protein n=1 Tax=Coniella lustricola TaxID=2025994 RepID=A0A2T3A773_9PEZI|nr:fungal-specific transcription factor domain-domain-containing protein [Coniella lustricola]